LLANVAKKPLPGEGLTVSHKEHLACAKNSTITWDDGILLHNAKLK